MLMKSLESRGFIKITFNWQYNYCYLTETGIEYLRTYLALPTEIVPNTHKKSQVQRPAMHDVKDDSGGRPAFRGGGGGGGGGFGRGGGI